MPIVAQSETTSLVSYLDQNLMRLVWETDEYTCDKSISALVTMARQHVSIGFGKGLNAELRPANDAVFGNGRRGRIVRPSKIA